MLISFQKPFLNIFIFTQIDWPKRPKDGTHSVEAEMQMRIGTSKPEAPDEDIEEAKLIRQCELRACADEDAMVFDIRAMTMKVIE